MIVLSKQAVAAGEGNAGVGMDGSASFPTPENLSIRFQSSSPKLQILGGLIHGISSIQVNGLWCVHTITSI